MGKKTPRRKSTPVSNKRGRTPIAPEMRHSDSYSLRIEPPKQQDPEEKWKEEDAPLEDEIAGMFKKWDGGAKMHAHIVFPPPKKNPTFVKKWKNIIETVASREGFKPAHLFQLEVLCDLFVEYEQLSKWIREYGYTYSAIGRQGKQIKTYPQVGERNRVKEQIRSYSKVLDLGTAKGAGTGKARNGGEWE